MFSKEQEKKSWDDKISDWVIEKICVVAKKLWMPFLLYLAISGIFDHFYPIVSLPMTIRIIICSPLFIALFGVVVFLAYLFTVPFRLFAEGDGIMQARLERRKEFLDWVYTAHGQEVFEQCCRQLDNQDDKSDPIKTLIERFLELERNSTTVGHTSS